MEIRKKIVKTVNSFIGQEEVRGNLGFKDEQFEELMKAVGWKTKQAWCAYFVELVWKLAFVGDKDTIERLDHTFDASAVKTWYNFRNSGWLTDTTPNKGDLAVWQTYKNGEAHWTGHIAIVTDILKGTRFKTVEGNTNTDGEREGYIVAEKNRNQNYTTNNGLRLLGFISPERREVPG